MGRDLQISGETRDERLETVSIFLCVGVWAREGLGGNVQYRWLPLGWTDGKRDLDTINISKHRGRCQQGQNRLLLFFSS